MSTPDRGMSLWAIDQTIAQLVALREDPDLTPEERTVVEQQLAMYAQEQLPAKVDGVRGYLKMCRTNETAAKAEKGVASDTEKMWGSRADRLEGICKDVMESRGVKRLDGKVGYISLRGNGGLQPMEPINEALLPDEYRMYRMALAAPAWRALQAILVGSQATLAPAILRAMLASVKAEVNVAAVRSALEAGTEVPGARLADRGSHLEVK